MATVTSENILKLRELTDKICRVSPNGDYEKVLKNVKSVIEEGEEEASQLTTSQNKIKCYEKMCLKINNILNSIKF
jgi:hypothetical protein